jgi:hypothetical protein
MDEKKFPRHRVVWSARGLKDKPWANDDARLNFLQMDYIDRIVNKIGGKSNGIEFRACTAALN